MVAQPQPHKEQRAGYGIDPAGAPVIDPTKNVLDLVTAAIQRQDDLRLASDRLNEVRITALREFQEARVTAQSLIQDWMRNTEMKRIKEKDEQRQFYETRIADMLRTSVESTSSLVSTQLVQIQNTFNDRVSQLERFRYETGGKTSITDPAIAESLLRHSTETARLKIEISESMTKMATMITDMRTSGVSQASRSMGHTDIGRAIAVASTAIGGLIIAGVAILGFLAAAPSASHQVTPVPSGYMLVPTPK